jgi:hypothetical protein
MRRRSVNTTGAARLLRRRVRQAAEDRIDAVKVYVPNLDHRARSRGRERGKHICKLLTGRALRRQRHDVNVGVVHAEADDLGACVARGAQHRHACFGPILDQRLEVALHVTAPGCLSRAM